MSSGFRPASLHPANHEGFLQSVARLNLALTGSTEQSSSEWALVWCTGAFGGVRVVAQFYFLAKTSATSLAMSGIAMQVSYLRPLGPRVCN